MNCESCIRANPINRCADSIYIPQITGTSGGSFNVVITNLSTGRVENIAVTAVSNTLTVLLNFELMLGQTYHVEVYEDGNYNEPRLITIGVTSACCVEFETRDFEIGGDTPEILSLDTCE